MLDKIAEKFRAFAESETRDSSPLYEQLSMAIAEDPEMLTLASEAQKGQPIPNMLFAAVHYLLLQSPTSALAATPTFSPSVGSMGMRLKSFLKRGVFKPT
jgi:hypothetical protein